MLQSGPARLLVRIQSEPRWTESVGWPGGRASVSSSSGNEVSGRRILELAGRRARGRAAPKNDNNDFRKLQGTQEIWRRDRGLTMAGDRPQQQWNGAEEEGKGRATPPLP